MVEAGFLDDLSHGSAEDCLDACRRLRSLKVRTDAAYLKPLFKRIQTDTSPELLSACLETIHRTVRQGRYAYSGAKRNDMCGHLGRVHEVLLSVFGPGGARFNGDMYAVMVLRDYARRYEYATALLVDAVGKPYFSRLVGSAPPERVAEHEWLVPPSAWNSLLEIYRASEPKKETPTDSSTFQVRYGSGALLAQFVFKNRALALKTEGLMEELLCDRCQLTAQTAMQVLLAWGARQRQLVPVLEKARSLFQGVEEMTRLATRTLCVVKGGKK